MKVNFNKAFQEIFVKKEQEVAKIKEKNKRIRKILQELNLPLDIIEPELNSIEKPELVLTVQDEEIKVERYLTAEQQKAAEEKKRLDEERLLRERGNNWRERGLNDMMNGVLEIRREDELKKVCLLIFITMLYFVNYIDAH